jgi:hypothetical protein
MGAACWRCGQVSIIVEIRDDGGGTCFLLPLKGKVQTRCILDMCWCVHVSLQRLPEIKDRIRFWGEFYMHMCVLNKFMNCFPLHTCAFM